MGHKVDAFRYWAQISELAYQTEIQFGWHTLGAPEKHPLIDHALITSEVAEMTEACRKPAMSEHIPDFTGEEEEAADIAIRLAGYARRRGLNLDAAISAKMKFNLTRSSKHGGKSV